MGYKSRWEYFRAIYGRYQKGDRKAREAILNEFCLNTGYHRKYAIRLLNGASPGPRANPSGVRVTICASVRKHPTAPPAGGIGYV